MSCQFFRFLSVTSVIVITTIMTIIIIPHLELLPDFLKLPERVLDIFWSFIFYVSIYFVFLSMRYLQCMFSALRYPLVSG